MKVFIAAVLLALVSIIGATSAQEPGLTDQLAVVKQVSGVLECRVISGNQPCGTDRFMLTVQADGSRMLRSNTQMPSRGMQIDIAIQVDSDFRPLQAYTSNYSEGKFFGTGLFAIEDNQLTAMVQTPDAIKTEIIEVPAQFSMLLHPVSADGWHFGHYDKAKGGVQVLSRCTVGAARDSVRCGMRTVELEYLSDETLTVPAGTFKTERYRFGDDTEVWLTGPDNMVVQHVYNTFGTRYQLTALEISDL